VSGVTKNKKAKVSPKNKDKCIPPVCFCENGELLENGGFEILNPDPFELFAGAISIKYPSRKAGGEIRSSQ
jgi:hypothetical protein